MIASRRLAHRIKVNCVDPEPWQILIAARSDTRYWSDKTMGLYKRKYRFSSVSQIRTFQTAMTRLRRRSVSVGLLAMLTETARRIIVFYLSKDAFKWVFIPASPFISLATQVS